MRLTSIVCVIVLSVTTLWADGAYPDAFRPLVAFDRGLAVPHPHRTDLWFVVQPRPAWETARPAVLLVATDGRRIATALPGANVRGAVTHRDALVVVVDDASGPMAVVLDGTLRERRRCALPVAARADGASREVMLLDDARRDAVYILLDGDLLILQPSIGTARMLEQRVSGMAVVDHGPYGLAYVYRAGPVGYLAVLDTLWRARVAPSVPIADAARVRPLGDRIVVLTPLDADRGTQITIVDPATSRTEFATVPVPVELITAVRSDAGLQAVCVRPHGTGHAVEVSPLLGVGTDVRWRRDLPAELGRPRRLRALSDRIVLIADGGVMTMDANGDLRSVDTLSMATPASAMVRNAGNDRIIVGDLRSSVVLQRHAQYFWWAVRFVRDMLAYIVPIILLGVIVVLIRRLRRQRRLIDAMMELPGSGMVLHLDLNGRLLRTNERAAQVLRITASVPMRRLYRTYALHPGVKGLLDFMTTVQSSHMAMTERVTIEDNGSQREYMFSAMPLMGSLGRYRGTVITGVDITEALERRRLVNWAQLAHDMQTNLSTIRLNAEQLEAGDAADAERRRRILFQVGILIQRVRDLVSVGRSEDVHRTPVHSAELCTEIRHEFDPSVFPHVSFSMKLRGTMMMVDRLKISRAVRNAVENGIKALRGQPGTIEIATWFDRTNVYIRVSDTGSGMDAATLANMMKPFFTTSSDGSGTGIGTMIMQHVVQQHGGTLRVTSEPGQGTQVIFRIPHGMDGPRWRGARYAAVDASTEDVA